LLKEQFVDQMYEKTSLVISQPNLHLWSFEIISDNEGEDKKKQIDQL